MNRKILRFLISTISALIFFFVAFRPGIFSMIGYTISLAIFPQNSVESVKYNDTIIVLIDVLLTLLVFFIVFKMTKLIFT